jgi:adenosine kinase
VGLGIDCQGLRLLDGEITATGFTTTDMDDNQLTGYYGGAMGRAAMLGLNDATPGAEALIVGPNDPGAMMRLVKECRDSGCRLCSTRPPASTPTTRRCRRGRRAPGS